MQKLLVAVDGSKVSDRVVRFAAGLKKTNKDSFITLISVSYSGLEIQKYSLVDPDFINECNAQSQRAIEKALEILKEEGVEPDLTENRHGEPATVISKLAKEEGYSMIVMGSRGLSDIKGFLLGSVSHKVLHIAECPVVIVK